MGYAIIQDGAHQYRVSEGDLIEVELKSTQTNGEVLFDRVLALGGEGAEPVVGTPWVEGAKVTAKVLGEHKEPKVIIHKYRRRKDSHVRRGHRQRKTRVRIVSIQRA
jgi:large subunit ribosomal protein L21